MLCDSAIIENAKENVMPIKEGRYLDDLAQTLRKPKEVLETRKEEYEAELNHLPSNSTDLESFIRKWDEYVEWIKESYPTDYSFDLLIPAYERCIQELTKLSDDNVDLMELSESYTTLKFLTDYAELRSPEDQYEVFEFMENRGICIDLPQFYEAAALSYACSRQYNKAFDVLNRGLSRLGSVVEEIYRNFAHKMEGKIADEKVKEEREGKQRANRKAFTELNTDELKAGFRVALQRKLQGFSSQAINTTPCKIASVRVLPDTFTQIGNEKKKDNTERGGEEPHKKKLRLIQSKIPEIRKGRSENIPTSERWSKVKIPQISILRSGTVRPGHKIDIFTDSDQEYRNDEGEITVYPKSLLISQTGEEQQFEEARMEKYLRFIKKQKKADESTLENEPKAAVIPEITDTCTKTELLERIKACPRLSPGKSDEKNEIKLETISDFILKQDSSTGNVRTAILYFLDEMLSCLISLRENEIIHGSISIKSFIYTTSFENNALLERNKSLPREFWYNRGLKLQDFGPRSIDTGTLPRETCKGEWPPHLRTLQERENWLWDVDIAGVFSALCTLMKVEIQPHGNLQNNVCTNGKGLDVISELWDLKRRDCHIEDIKKLRSKVERILFGDRRKVAATKAALVWIELNLLLAD